MPCQSHVTHYGTYWNKRKRSMPEISKTVRGWIVLSVVYALIAGVLVVKSNQYDVLLLIVVVSLPLIAGWGIWWVNRGK